MSKPGESPAFIYVKEGKVFTSQFFLKKLFDCCSPFCSDHY